MVTLDVGPKYRVTQLPADRSITNDAFPMRRIGRWTGRRSPCGANWCRGRQARYASGSCGRRRPARCARSARIVPSASACAAIDFSPAPSERGSPHVNRTRTCDSGASSTAVACRRGTAAKAPVRRQAAEMALSMPICYPSAMVEAKRPKPGRRRCRCALPRGAPRAVRRQTGTSKLLFGSRARGDARPDSDYDVAIFLRDYTRAWPEIQPLGKITTDILQDTGAVISALPFPAGSFRDRTMLMAEIRREGSIFDPGSRRSPGHGAATSNRCEGDQRLADRPPGGA